MAGSRKSTKKRRNQKRKSQSQKRTVQQQGEASLAQTALARLQARDFEQAKQLCCLGLESQPRNADLWHVLGLTLLQSGYPHEAIAAFEQAISVQPNNAALLSNLGSAYSETGNVESAQSAFEKALRIQPDFPQASNNLGNACRELGQLDDAESHYRNALKSNPNYPEALNNLGVVLNRKKQLEEAEECYEAALKLNPQYVSALSNLASLYIDQGKGEKAFRVSQQVLALKPDFSAAHINLGFALADQGYRKESLRPLRHAADLDPSCGSSYLYRLSSENEIDPQVVHAEHVWWGGKMEALSNRRVIECDRSPDRRLRVGYVSPDYRQHVVAAYLQPILENHNREQFEVYGYAEITTPDEVTESMRGIVDQWRWTQGRNNEQVATQIQNDKIDLLVDLAGHTVGNRLGVFALKPAPLQFTWIGYPNSTGLKSIDYRITHPYQDPIEEQSMHTEKLLYLPSGVTSYRPPSGAPDVRSAPFEQNGFITFGSLQRLSKINETTLDLWCRVLKRVKNSRLLMFWPGLKNQRADEFRERFDAAGIEDHRIDMLCDAGEDGYLSVYHKIDIGLDVHPWTGSTTAREAMWMGVLVIALYGDRRASRGSASVLHQLQLDQYVAKSFDEYVAIADKVAAAPQQLSELRFKLRDAMKEKVCDAERFTRELEETYRAVWREFCNRP